jgi:quinol monooxygenase YgiN
MSKHVLLARLQATLGKIDEFEAALRDLIDAADEEPATEIYAVHAAGDGVYWFYEVYADEAARAVHGKGDRMRTAMAALGPFLAGRPEITSLTPIAGKGISF